MFAISLRYLEDISGQPLADVELALEIDGRVSRALADLGLDPAQAGAEDIYRGLIDQFRHHNRRLESSLNLNDASTPKALAEATVGAYQGLKLDQTGWFLKEATAGRLLQQQPPDKLIKALDSDSIEDCLAKHDLVEIFALAGVVQGRRWFNSFCQNYQQLKPADFSSRKIRLKVLSNRYRSLLPAGHNPVLDPVLVCQELGLIGVYLPRTGFKKVTSLWLLICLLESLNQLKLYSSFFKLKSRQADFGQLLAAAIAQKSAPVANLVGSRIDWRVCQRYFGRLKSAPAALFNNRLKADDLSWQPAETVLGRLLPELEFWRGLDYVGCLDGRRPLSFNLLDVGLNAGFDKNFNNRSFKHLQASLWDELFGRYLAQKTLMTAVVDQVNNKLELPETLVARQQIDLQK